MSEPGPHRAPLQDSDHVMLEWSVTGMVYADSPVNQSLVVLIAQHLDLVEPNGET